jgi:hypothetical protein
MKKIAILNILVAAVGMADEWEQMVFELAGTA